MVTAAFALSSVLTPFALGAAIGGDRLRPGPVGNAAGDEIWQLDRRDLDPDRRPRGRLLRLPLRRLHGRGRRAPGLRAPQRTPSGPAASSPGCSPGPLRSPGSSSSLRRSRIYDGLTSGAGLAAVLVSAAAGAAALWLLWARRFEAARYSAALAVAATVAGWGIAQSPVFLPGLTIQAGGGGPLDPGRATRLDRRRPRAAGALAGAALRAGAARALRPRGRRQRRRRGGRPPGPPRVRLAVPIVLGAVGAVLTVDLRRRRAAGARRAGDARVHRHRLPGPCRGRGRSTVQFG